MRVNIIHRVHTGQSAVYVIGSSGQQQTLSKVFRESKVICRFFDCKRGSVCLILVLFKGELDTKC